MCFTKQTTAPIQHTAPSTHNKCLPVAEVELSQHLSELALVDGAAAVLVDLLEQQVHEL